MERLREIEGDEISRFPMRPTSAVAADALAAAEDEGEKRKPKRRLCCARARRRRKMVGGEREFYSKRLLR